MAFMYLFSNRKKRQVRVLLIVIMNVILSRRILKGICLKIVAY